MKIALLHAAGLNKDGSIDNETRARTMKAADVFLSGEIEVIYITAYLTRAKRNIDEGMSAVLLFRGIPESNIRIIPRGQNTLGEIDVFLENVSKKKNELFSISSSYHMPRIIRYFRRRNVYNVTPIGARHGFPMKAFLEPLKGLHNISRQLPRNAREGYVS